MGCDQFFCRRQQQDNCAGGSSFEPARHGTGYGFASGRRVYSIIHDLPRIAGPSWIVCRICIQLHQEGPAAHRCLVSIVCRSYEKKHDFAGPPRQVSTSTIVVQYENSVAVLLYFTVQYPGSNRNTYRKEINITKYLPEGNKYTGYIPQLKHSRRFLLIPTAWI